MRALAQLAPWHAAPVDVEALRVRAYRRFANTGGTPRLEELARELDESVTTIRTGLRDLAAARHLVLDKHDAIVMAHPFSAIQLGFSVMSATTLWWGGAHGIPLHCRIWCLEPSRCWWPRAAQDAAARTPGT